MGRTSIIPLGGLGEIGRNALALETEDDLVLVDCGLQFAQLHRFGVDYLIPDFSYVKARRDKLRAILLTHGHDDHLGAVPHLLRDLPVPVFGTPFALGLLEERMAEVCPGGRGLLRRVYPGGAVGLGSIRASWLRVTHSTPESCALAIETPAGVVVHTGDFTFDPSPVDGRLTDDKGLTGWGDRGVDVLCCDSTNASLGGATPSERDVGTTLRRLIPAVCGRVYFATFASHAHRIQQAIEVSRESGRRVTLLGRSINRGVAAARGLGHLKTAPGDLVPERRSRNLPRNELTVILGGSQAEPGSALRRVAHGLEPFHRIVPGDQVFLSARSIPGNEASIHRLVNRCIRMGAEVHCGEDSGIHVSGHPSAADVARMIRLTRPRHVVPVHGELQHLEALATIAAECEIPAERVHRVEDGQILLLEDGMLTPGPSAPAGRQLIRSGEADPIDEALLATRRRLAREGLALAFCARRGQAQPPGWEIRIRLLGVVSDASSAAVARQAEAALRTRLAEGGGPPADPHRLEEEILRCLGRHFRKWGGRRPVVRTVILGDLAEPDAHRSREVQTPDSSGGGDPSSDDGAEQRLGRPP